MTRIKKCFEKLRQQNEKALVAFITGGDPDLETTKRLILALGKNGADIIEIGVPFTDPLADGPVILKSALRSLNAGTTLNKILQMVKDVRTNSQIPIMLMSSYNPIFVHGEENFVDDAVTSGVDGVIIPDLPPDESERFEGYAKEKDLDVIYLLAPTSAPERIEMVVNRSAGFIYYISLTGVTGTRERMPDGLAGKVAQIKEKAKIPVLIGFGISGPKQAAEACKISDGVIVGSAIVKLIESNSGSTQCEFAVSDFIAKLKAAIKG